MGPAFLKRSLPVQKLKTYLNWSSGKDSALALYDLQHSGEYEVQLLLTTVNAHYGRVSMHGLRKEVLLAQAAATGLPLQIVELPVEVTNEVYENHLGKTVEKLSEQGFKCAAFGDILLADLRAYREQQLADKGLKAVFPLWDCDTKLLAQRFLETGFKAIVVTVDAAKLDRSFVGRTFDEAFLADLPAGIDPCGENGEFHTFCYDGPIFRHPVLFEAGEIVYREYSLGEGVVSGFWYCDLILV